MPVQKHLQAPAGYFGQGKFACGGKGFGPLVELVGKLDLGAGHDVDFTLNLNDVNLPSLDLLDLEMN